jgi:hypothetical protein
MQAELVLADGQVVEIAVRGVASNRIYGRQLLLNDGKHRPLTSGVQRLRIRAVPTVKVKQLTWWSHDVGL